MNQEKFKSIFDIPFGKVLMLGIGGFLTIASSVWVKHAIDDYYSNKQIRNQIVTNNDGTVNVDGTLLNRFVDAYEKQITFQSRQLTLQEQMANVLAQIQDGNRTAAADRSRMEGKLDALLNRS